jgi:hypothetical protein
MRCTHSIVEVVFLDIISPGVFVARRIVAIALHDIVVLLITRVCPLQGNKKMSATAEQRYEKMCKLEKRPISATWHLVPPHRSTLSAQQEQVAIQPDMQCPFHQYSYRQYLLRRQSLPVRRCPACD